jgi:hypothetical protein
MLSTHIVCVRVYVYSSSAVSSVSSISSGSSSSSSVPLCMYAATTYKHIQA